jgi:hypothetical protein
MPRRRAEWRRRTLYPVKSVLLTLGKANDRTKGRTHPPAVGLALPADSGESASIAGRQVFFRRRCRSSNHPGESRKISPSSAFSPLSLSALPSASPWLFYLLALLRRRSTTGPDALELGAANIDHGGKMAADWAGPADRAAGLLGPIIGCKEWLTADSHGTQWVWGEGMEDKMEVLQG